MSFRFKDEDEFTEFLAQRGLIEVTPGHIITMETYLHQKVEAKMKEIRRQALDLKIQQNTHRKPWYKKLFGR